MPAIDEIQELIDKILCSSNTYESKMLQLQGLEPTISDYYAQGLTHVKPVSAMTADDLVF